MVYAVEGGMEDWGYAAGWENEAYQKEIDEGKHKDVIFPIIDECKPKVYGGKKFDSDSRVDQIHTRASMILIETSDDKAPARELMGDRSDDNKCVLQYLDTAFYEGVDNDDRADCKKRDGHVPRNMRICLSLIDLAAPYVNVRKAERN